MVLARGETHNDAGHMGDFLTRDANIPEPVITESHQRCFRPSLLDAPNGSAYMPPNAKAYVLEQ